MSQKTDDNGPLQVHREQVQKEWIDYNGHLNMAYYLLLFDHATDAFFDVIGLGEITRTKLMGLRLPWKGILATYKK